MKNFLFLSLLLLVWTISAQENAKSATELKKEMGRIMHETDWTNKAEADSANARIAELSKQMMLIGARQQAPQNGIPEEQYNEKLKEDVEYKMQLWNQMWNIGRSGNETNIDLASPLRTEIVEEYKEDDNPAVKNPEWMESMTDLTINMSMPNVQIIIDQMPVFKGIKRLIITCEALGTPVNLHQILENAKGYPLSELHILNFGSEVTSLPAQIGGFKELEVLNLLNNSLYQIPATVSGITSLRTMYIDLNPVDQLLTVVSPLKNLATLGVAKTNLSGSEIEQIQSVLPDCNILTQ